ncbi:hypothetical protein ASPZODRAFT_154801 [Penicilliopsis zonata CBS 506.65]|uniref:Thioredoxin-like fold domain-containing protein n=1 Tax=Penicilliopsis zonata CBS 506.65 TaxID=1073090 RepID=A0A1L9S7C2_9EURO|nr:hypothetical protein ASPZODRAFT_154801 [Penicilliopsis zonata CBS 506.65]OJJ43059.1 hypothetical protein ASPZODRAFT_154801 [Penicilliopsis zonata CBS 506.65]
MVFRFPKTLDPITLFHSPAVPASKRVLTLLKQASATASETATEDQASDTNIHAAKQRGEFQLQVSTEAPTTDQVRSILEFVADAQAAGRTSYAAGEVVAGARDAADALRKFKEDQSKFARPITVDWTNGRAVVGDNESEILKMVRQAE